MFEDSLVESRLSHLSSSKRWTAIASIGLQSAAAASLILFPLLSPEAPSFRVPTVPVLLPIPMKPPVPTVVRTQAPPSAVPWAREEVAARASIPGPALVKPANSSDEAPAMNVVRFGDGWKDNVSAIAAGPRIVRLLRAEPVRLSSLNPGMLISPIRPVYPAIARSAGVQGTVVVEAVISPTGAIESIQAISGPQLLRRAAVDAIREARYRPYLLNGQPTAVETTIIVNFRMGG
jgi:periplasmic protein TonB